MHEDIQISIIVPVYKVEKTLFRCLDSILKQSFSDYEIILVDDASPDNSGHLCDVFYNEHPNQNITVIHKTENQGLGMARNTGLSKAKGKYIFFLDSDDEIKNDTLKNLWKNITETNSDTCLGGFTRVTNGRNQELFPNITKKYIEGDEILELISRMIGPLSDGTDSEYHMVAKNLFSLDLIKQNNIYFESERVILAEDCIFSLDYFKYAKRVCSSNYPGYIYYDNENSLTTSYRANRFELLNNLADAIEKRLIQIGIDIKEFDRFKRTFLIVSQRCISQEVRFQPFSIAKKHIQDICNNQRVQNFAIEMANTNSSLLNKIMDYLIIHKHCNVLYFIFYLYNVKKGR